MSLKHKNTSKWSKAQNRYAKYSDRAREQVQEQLEISKQLTKKVKLLQKNHDSDEEQKIAMNSENQQEKAINLGELLTNSNGLLENNPWMKMLGDINLNKSTKSNGEISNNDESSKIQDYSRPKAFIDKIEIQKAQNELNLEDDKDEDYSDNELNGKSKHPDIIDIFKNNLEKEDENMVKYKRKKNETVIDEKKTKKVEKVELMEIKDQITNDEVKISNEKKKENNISPIDSINFKEVNLSTKKTDAEKHQITLSEAFADDDVIEEFKAEKVNRIILLIQL
jgi:hypothetical protein